MTYAQNCRITDVDIHVIELEDFLANAADPSDHALIPSMSEQQELLGFASDYTHPESTSDPISKFEATMTGCDPETLNAFYRGNMAKLMRLD